MTAAGRGPVPFRVACHDTGPAQRVARPAVEATGLAQARAPHTGWEGKLRPRGQVRRRGNPTDLRCVCATGHGIGKESKPPPLCMLHSFSLYVAQHRKDIYQAPA